MDQTGPKTQEGGLKEGRIRSVKYQVFTDEEVAILPMMPAPSVIKIQKMNLIKLNLFFDFDFIVKYYYIIGLWGEN